MKIEMFDSTLRDGAQGEGIAFSPSDKLKIALTLDTLGLAYLEAGNPGSNVKDLEFFHMLADAPIQNMKICAFGSTRHKGIAPEDDASLCGLVAANTQVVSLFGKSSVMHVREVLSTTPEENLRMIYDSVSYLRSLGKEVIYDAEHFFDGFAENEEFAMATLFEAARAGAATLCLCDTNGGTYVSDVSRITGLVCKRFPSLTIGIHCHNDCGLAVANSMAAVDAGATHVQGTYIGFGERCGNANLSTIIPNLQLKRGYSCIPPECLRLITPAARRIADVSNFVISGQKPYIGSSAFAHKGGMHADAVSKVSSSFEHVDPSQVGNRRRFLMSEVAGKSALMKKINAIDPSLTKDSPETALIVERLKELEYRGYQFEAAEESFELVIRRILGKTKKFFSLEYFKIIGEQPRYSRVLPSSALLKVNVDGQTEITAAEGNGPVNALDLALRKALSRFYPTLDDVRLIDFKVRVLESDATTAANVRVYIESTDGLHRWATVGVSTDIIEASFLALTDSVEYKLLLDYGQPQ